MEYRVFGEGAYRALMERRKRRDKLWQPSIAYERWIKLYCHLRNPAVLYLLLLILMAFLGCIVSMAW